MAGVATLALLEVGLSTFCGSDAALIAAAPKTITPSQETIKSHTKS
jgi:hypothetical protein